MVIELNQKLSITVAQKGTREAATAATAEEPQRSDHKNVANSEEEEEEDSTSDSEKRKRDIVDWIGRPRKPLSRNEDEEAEGEEENFSATQASTEDNSHVD